MSKCPYCYRTLGTHTHDPILLPDGSKYKWFNDTILIEESDISKRIYKGTYQVKNTIIIELQNELRALEEENNVIPLTTFSPLNSSGRFQITGKHIKEMRDSVEKLLNIFGLVKYDYFNYDEDGNHIIHPAGDKLEWTDPINESTDLLKFQIKNIHIEDLRHYLQTLIPFRENWEYSNPYTYTFPYGGHYSFIGQDSKIWSTSDIALNSGSYIQVTNDRSLIFHAIANPTSGALPAITVNTVGSILNKIKTNQKLYFDINDINIDIHWRGSSPADFLSYDAFGFLITLKNYIDGHTYPIYWFFNYHPEYFFYVRFSSEAHNILLKGDLSLAGNLINLYQDSIEVYPNIIDYYNGVLDSRGCYVYNFNFLLGINGYDSYFNHVEIDNLIVAGV
jgi:hypothetical protein